MAVQARQKRRKELWSSVFGIESLFAPQHDTKFESCDRGPLAPIDLVIEAYVGDCATTCSVAADGEIFPLGGLHNLGLTCYV